MIRRRAAAKVSGKRVAMPWLLSMRLLPHPDSPIILGSETCTNIRVPWFGHEWHADFEHQTRFRQAQWKGLIMDSGSLVVALVTLLLFLAALFTKGVTHDLFLEAGVFLVSVKIILMAYRNSMSVRMMQEKLEKILAAVKRDDSKTP
jgi:hypothetical protein